MPRRHADRPPAATARPSPGAQVELVKKYEALTRKYQQSVKLLAARTRRDADLVAMTSWALRRSDSAWVYVRGKGIAFGNRALHAMNRSRDGEGPWQPTPHPLNARGRSLPDCSYASLTELVVQEAARLRNRPQEGLPLRFRTRQRMVEVTLDRLGPRAEGSATLAVIRDITTISNMEANLAESHAILLRQERVRSIGEVALGVAHDVSNILGALQLRVKILAHDEICRGAQAQNIAALERILTDAAGLVGRLQSLARPGGQRPQPFDLRETILRAVEIAQSGLRLRARETGVELRIEHEVERLPPVLGVSEDVLHLFVNLLVNAKDAMPEGGTIRIRAKAAAESVTVLVEDEGTGIPEGMAEKLFQPFFTTKGQRGSGLGLAMAREVAERAGGSIRAYNRPEGGARFEVCFVRQPPARPVRARPRTNAVPRLAAR